MSARNLPITVDAVDLADAVDEAEQAQADADRIAAKFSTVAADINAFAEFVQAHPHLAKHMRYADLRHRTNRVNVYVYTAEVIAEFARAAARAGRKVTKRLGGTDDAYFGILVSFGWVEMYVYATRAEVCDRVVIGTDTVVTEVPDPKALAAVPTVRVVETVERVEWHCGPLLGGGRDA